MSSSRAAGRGGRRAARPGRDRDRFAGCARTRPRRCSRISPKSAAPGGAALAALLAAADGVPVVLVAPLGDDEASATVRSPARAARHRGPGAADRAAAGEDPVPDRRPDPAAGRPGPAGSAQARASQRPAAEAIAAAGAVLVSDYGRGITADPRIRAALGRQAARVPLVWDPHPKGAGPVPRTRLATPNHAEAVAAAGLGRKAPAGQLLRSAAAGRGPAGPALAGRQRGGHPGRRRARCSYRAAAARWSSPPGRWRSPTPAARATASPPRPRRRSGAGALPSEAVTAATEAATILPRGGVAPPSTPPPRVRRATAAARAVRGAVPNGRPGRAGRPRRPGRSGGAGPRIRSPGRRCGRRAVPWSPPAAASTCCTPATSACCRRPARWATA